MAARFERLRSVEDQPERLPPQNTDAEEALLGSVLLDREVVGRVAGVVKPADFYRDRNGTIYGAMLDLYERHEPVDYLTLSDELMRTERYEQAGGPVYLSGLLGVVPTPVHAEQYAKLIADTAFMRRMISAGGKIAAMGFENREPPDTVLERAEQILFEAAARRRSVDFRALSDVLSEYLDRLATFREEGETTSYGVPTGYRDLDQILAGGLQRSDLALLAARPGMGKTSLGLCIAANLTIRFKASAAMFSLEMSAGQVAARLLSIESGIETTRLRASRIGELEERRLGSALAALADASFWIDDTVGNSATSLRAKARRLHAEVPLDLVIVDHLQLMTSGSGRRDEDRVSEMSEISRQLKGLARELHVPVLAISQLNRSVEQRSSKVPVLSDLRDSGALEQDADVVAFIHRDDYYDKDSEKQGMADIHIAKHRNGPTGQISLMFNSRTTKFLELEVS